MKQPILKVEVNVSPGKKTPPGMNVVTISFDQEKFLQSGLLARLLNSKNACSELAEGSFFLRIDPKQPE